MKKTLLMALAVSLLALTVTPTLLMADGNPTHPVPPAALLAEGGNPSIPPAPLVAEGGNPSIPPAALVA